MMVGEAGGGEGLLTPEVLSGLTDLEWAGELVARGVGAGVHRSAFVGRGEEFERHRPYQQGDDLRHLDWRLLARTDRLYVRRFRETSNLQAMFVVDASASMGFGGGAGSGASGVGRPTAGSGAESREAVSKLRYAVLLAAALGHLSRQAGDRPGMAVSGGGREGPDYFAPRAAPGAWRAILERMSELRAEGRESLAATLDRVGEQVPAGGRIVVFSDFLDDDGGRAVAQVAGRLRARGDEVTAVRILTPVELGEAGDEEALYADPEDPDRAIPGRPAGDPGYLRRLTAYYGELSRALADRGVIWREARTTDPLVPLIRRWVREPGPAPR